MCCLVRILVLLGVMSVSLAAHAQIRPVNLRCEYLMDPIGIDSPRPRLSWELESAERGQTQTAYAILVATTADLLESGQADLWDSGKIESDQSAHVVYAGAPLGSDVACIWKVRAWDRNGKPSEWSEAATWSMGVLSPDAWAQWIASPDVEPERPTIGLDGANWVWFPEGEPATQAPKGARIFERQFELPASPALKRALFVVSADDRFNVDVNGRQGGQGSDWKGALAFDYTTRLQPGENVIRVSAANEDDAAGLAAKLVLEMNDGRSTTIVTDGSWMAMRPDDDASRTNAAVLGPVGMAPWGMPQPALAGPTQTRPSPLFRKAFTAEKPVRRATVNISGLGYHELYLNGEKVCDRVLDPAFTRYDKRVLYSTYDVTGHIADGANALGVLLGNGWYNMHTRATWDFDRAPWRGQPRLIARLRMEYEDGSVEVVGSDATWKCAPGPVVFDSIRNGEHYDARAEQPGWDAPGFDDSAWAAAVPVDAPGGTLRAQQIPPARVTGTLKPVSVSEPLPGVFVYNMGQNFSGWVRLKLTAPAGTTVTIRYDERLTADGRVDQSNDIYVYSGEFQTDRYTCKGGGEEVWEPRFVYHGFQYVQIEGFPGTPALNTIEGRAVNTDFEMPGSFECSLPLFNDIQRNTRWAYLSNFVGYPTDCPHREKNGWTGDAHLAAEQALYTWRSEAAYLKWLDDIKDEQPEQGDLPGIVPTSGWGYGHGPSWDSAYVLIPWYLYVYRGDTQVLEDHYEGMKRLVDYLTTRAENGIVSYGLGDWAPAKTKTPAAVTSTGYYFVDATIVSKAAALLGKTEDAQKYAALAGEIREAFNDAFYKYDSGGYAEGSQTALACALYQGLAEEADVPRVVENLVAAVDAENGHLDCGILGTKYLLHALTDNGRADVAYTVATQTTYPSWGEWLAKGATTLWEHWDGSMSQNHIMYGDISAWFYRGLAGIAPDEEHPGFKRFTIHPHPVGELTWVRAEVPTNYGVIRSAWERNDSGLVLDIEVPVNTTAVVYVPCGDADSVEESGRPAAESRGVAYIGREADCAVYNVDSGRYRFVAK